MLEVEDVKQKDIVDVCVVVITKQKNLINFTQTNNLQNANI
jgi:hypothetical protein